MKTILHYTDVKGFGGAEAMLLTLLRGLDRARWRPILVCHTDPSIELLVSGARECGVEVDQLPRDGQGTRLGAVATLSRSLARYRASIFHAHLTWPLRCSRGIAAAAIARIPHRIATQQLFVPYRLARKRRRQRMISLLVDRYVAVSETMAQQLRPTVSSAGKVTVVHNGIVVSRYQSSRDAALRVALADDRPLVLTIARLDPQKDLDTLIGAADALPDVVFVIAGEGPERARLEREVARRGLQERVRLLGHRTDVPDLLAAADLFVLPSRFEGLPVSVLEAMAAKCPVVASAVEGTDEAVEDGVTGLLVHPGHTVELAHAIRRVLDSPTLASGLATAAYQRVQQRFSDRAMVRGVEQIYHELLHGRVSDRDRERIAARD